jgi:hypothetical protein
MKTVETKREEVQRKQTLREARISKAGSDEPAAEVPLTNGINGTNEGHEDDAAKLEDELPDRIKTTIQHTLKKIFGEEETAEPGSAPVDTANPKEWEHLNVFCNLCNVSPIVGLRYKCTKYALSSFSASFAKREI